MYTYDFKIQSFPKITVNFQSNTTNRLCVIVSFMFIAQKIVDKMKILKNLFWGMFFSG